jgi:hypothetical protein
LWFQTLLSICDGCVNLTALNVSQCRHFATPVVAALSKLPHLTELDLSGILTVTDDAVSAIALRGQLKVRILIAK